MCRYQAYVLSILFYGKGSWTTYARQERRLNGFHLRCLRRPLHIRWQDKVPNIEVLERASLMNMPSLTQGRLRWLGPVHRIEPDCLPRETENCGRGARRVGRPLLQRRQQVWLTCCSNQHKHLGGHCQTPRHLVAKYQSGFKTEVNAKIQATFKRAARMACAATACDPTIHICAICNKDCHSKIGLHSHTRSCPNLQR